MAKESFKRSRPALGKTTPAEAAVAEQGADTPATQQQSAQPTSRRKLHVPRKPFGVPLSVKEREQLEDCAELADKTARSFSTRLLKWAMDMYLENPNALPRN